MSTIQPRMSGRKIAQSIQLNPNRMSDCQYLQPIEIRRPSGLRTKFPFSSDIELYLWSIRDRPLMIGARICKKKKKLCLFFVTKKLMAFFQGTVLVALLRGKICWRLFSKLFSWRRAIKNILGEDLEASIFFLDFLCPLQVINGRSLIELWSILSLMGQKLFLGNGGQIQIRNWN